MLLGSLDIDRLRQLVADGKAIPKITYDGCEVGAALELACAYNAWQRTPAFSPGVDLVQRWARDDARLAQAVAALNGTRANVGRFDAPAFEFGPLGARDALDDQAHGLYDRFRRSLLNNGFGQLSWGIAKAMAEMADNAIQHSGADELHPERGAMGYAVEQGAATFAIVDIGRGMLASLRTNPQWSGLGSARDALDAAVAHAASRRVGQGMGHGFSDVHKALADLSGRLRFASGDAVMKYEGEPANRVLAWQPRPSLDGMQVAVFVRIHV
jgi:hypothetical protein